MTTAADVIAVARSQIGYVETPDNVTKYWQELDPALQGQPWCAVFVSWVFQHAGYPLPAMDRPYGFIGVRDATNYAKANGLFSESGHYAPGDIVLYGATGGDHTGIIVTDDGINMVTIEGNTGTASVTNGGGVYENTRAHNDWVYGAFQTSKLLGKDAPMLTGDDVSSWQNVSQEATYAHDFVVVKATQGTGYINPLYADQVKWARDNHKLVMHYHFNNMGGVQAEADYFLAHADIKPGELVSLDMENGAEDNAGALWALQFLQYLDSKVTGSPVIYLNQSWATFMGGAQPGLHKYPLWIADYEAPAGAPHLCGWPVWTFHQYNHLPIDLDIFNGNAATWAALAGGSKPPPIDPTKPAFMFTISRQCRNPFLTRMVQTRLISLGYVGGGADPVFVVDGDFGDETAKWVGLFQSRHGLTSDGIVGNLTWNALFA